SLIGVLAQRLVRRLCDACKEPHAPDAAEAAEFAGREVPRTLYRAKGCPECAYTGYAGRMGIYELLEISDTVRRMIHDRVSDQVIREHARDVANVRFLREDGLRWVAAGHSMLEEILRATRD
ncbi:MAG TPA: type II secretion system protein GspE, partial [Burkholderiales bacterium]|nr:type II secretion system protein GspE [Burkholderiales bacterium]